MNSSRQVSARRARGGARVIVRLQLTAALVAVVVICAIGHSQAKALKVEKAQNGNGITVSTAQWREGSHFVVRVESGELTVMASAAGIHDSSVA